MALIDYSKYDMEKFTVEEINLCHYIRQKYDELIYSVTARPINSFILIDNLDKDLLIINCSYAPKYKKPTLISTEITKSHQFHHEHAERLFNSIHDKVYGKIKENPNNPTQKQIKTADLLIATIKKVEVKMEQPNNDIMREGMQMKKLIETIISKCELMGKLHDNLTSPIYKIYAIKDVNRIGIQMSALGAHENHYAFIENVPSSDFVKLYNKCYTDIVDGWHISTKGRIVDCTWDKDETSHEMIPLSDIMRALKNDQKQLEDAQKSNLLNAIVEKIHSIHAHIPNEVLKEEINKKLGQYHSFSDQYATTISNHYRYEYSVFRSTVIESVHKYFKDSTDDNYSKAVKLINDFTKYEDPLIKRLAVKLHVFHKVRTLIIDSGYKVTIRSNHLGYPCGECKISYPDNTNSRHILIKDDVATKGVIVRIGGEVLLGINHEHHKIRVLAQELIEQFNKLGDHLPIDLYCKITT